jgi:peptide-methionine (R)-S-oxide reductase
MAKIPTDTELKEKLTPEQYHILREQGTEAPFTGKFLHNKETGMYVCAVCGRQLFDSKTKFESGSGWPSFYEVINSGAVKLNNDRSHGMQRTEVVCANCGGHLGHLFNDAPDQPTGKRFCINSASLDFMPEKSPAKPSEK